MGPPGLSPPTLAGMDPSVVAAAIQAGIPHDQLRAMSRVLAAKPKRLEDYPRPAQEPMEGESESEDVIDPGDAAPDLVAQKDPMADAVLKLTNIVTKLSKKKVDSMDDVFTGVSIGESGSADSSSTLGRKHAAAREALKRAFRNTPERYGRSSRPTWKKISICKPRDPTRATWLFCPWVGRISLKDNAIPAHRPSCLGRCGNSGFVAGQRCECCASSCVPDAGAVRAGKPGSRVFPIGPRVRHGTPCSTEFFPAACSSRCHGDVHHKVDQPTVDRSFCRQIETGGQLHGNASKVECPQGSYRSRDQDVFRQGQGGRPKRRREAEKGRQEPKGRRAGGGEHGSTLAMAPERPADLHSPPLPGSSLSARRVLSPTEDFGRGVCCEGSSDRGDACCSDLPTPGSGPVVHENSGEARNNSVNGLIEAMGGLDLGEDPGGADKIAGTQSPFEVPGAKASSIRIHSLWHSLIRQIQRSGTRFAKFFNAMQREPQGAERKSSTASAWPMPLPFNLKGAALENAGANLAFLKLINLQVGFLNFLYLDRPDSPPSSICGFAGLTDLQRSIVSRLQRLSGAWNDFESITPEDMGRVAAKQERQESVLRELGNFATPIVQGLKKYQRVSAGVKSVKPVALQSRKVGQLKKGDISGAQGILASRIKMEGIAVI